MDAEVAGIPRKDVGPLREIREEYLFFQNLHKKGEYKSDSIKNNPINHDASKPNEPCNTTRAPNKKQLNKLSRTDHKNKLI